MPEDEEDITSLTSFYKLVQEYTKFNVKMKSEGLDMRKVEALLDQIPSKCPIDRVPVSEACDPLERFIYEPLKKPNTIRVLVLHMGDEMDPLEGSLQEEVLGRVVNYTPVSYAWGDDSTPCSMLLNGRQLPLTQSLHDALRCMRRHNSDRVIWADGICINQADDEEKSIQVSLIPKIFEQTGVRVWLGAAADDSDSLFDIFEELSTGNADYFQPLILADHLSRQTNRIWHALCMFLHRPWFRRLWVAPEVILAKDVRFLCGTKEIDWQPLLQIAGVINHPSADIRRCVKEMDMIAREASFTLDLMLSYRIKRSTFARRINKLRDLVEGKRSVSEELIIKNLPNFDATIQALKDDHSLLRLAEKQVRCLPSTTGPACAPILVLFISFMFSKVAKPQDRLYVLASLAGDITLEDFRPDYRESIEEANIRFSRVMITKGQGMDMLRHATHFTADAPLVPSWAVNWTSERNVMTDWLSLSWQYKGEGGFDGRIICPTLVSLVDSCTLRVSGHLLDICQDPVVRWQTLDEDTWSNPGSTNLEDLVANLIFSRSIFTGKSYFTGESWFEVAAQTLIADPKLHESGYKEIVPNILRDDPDIDLFEYMLNTSPTMEVTRELSWRLTWLCQARRKMSGYAVCKTSKGYVGVVPNRTVATDVIFMFEGCDMPFVLRPDKTRPNYYSFIGGCYIHGMMRGEAWKREHTNAELFLV